MNRRGSESVSKIYLKHETCIALFSLVFGR
jgi:hypothetical protein